MSRFGHPNLLNCYWAGMSAADCNILKKSDNNYWYKLDLALPDEQHLKQLKLDTGHTGPITYCQRINKKRKGARLYNSCVVNISCTKWGQDLESNFSITQRKTLTLQPPNLKDIYLIYAFIIGFIDGDGNIHARKKNFYKSLSLGFFNSSKDIMIWIKNSLNTIVDLNDCNISQIKNSKCYQFTISGQKSAIIVDFFRQFNLPRLARKWDKPEVIEMINRYKSERPDLFKTLNLNEIAHLLPPPKISQHNISQP